MKDTSSERDEKEYFFDKPGRLQRFLFCFYALCLLLFVGDYFVPKQHLHFSWEESFGFYAVYGFVSCVILVLLAKYVLRPLVMRKEDFYD